MLTAEEVARAYNLAITDFSPGHRYTTCPQCSRDRKKKRAPCLGYTITPEGGLSFGCNHCEFRGPNAGDSELGFREKRGDVPWTGEREDRVSYPYGPDLRHYGKPNPIWKHLNGKGEWENGRGDHDIANLLYRIDEARETIKAGGIVFVAEGEPDVETCRRLGFAAVCNASGASGWRKTHSAQLHGANLVVLNDNDEPGYKYAETVCRCSVGVAASIRRLDLKSDWPDIPENGDISDWARSARGSASRLRDLIPFAIPYTATAPPKEEKKELGGEVFDIGDFFAYLPEHNYIYRKTGQRWPGQSVNDKVAKVGRFKATTWLGRHQSVEQMTWMPGEPEVIKDRYVINSGWITHKGAKVYNLYRAPNLKLGNPARAHRWIEHVQKIYPDDADYIIKWCAHRCQHPNIKINHALFLGGAPGIGKDTLLDPVRYTVGEWNCETTSPTQLTGRFNPFLRSVILVISEARDLGDLARPAFYEHTKLIMASPPDALPIDEKNTKPYYIPNLVGVIITSNHKAGGIFLPSDDRRHYVAWSNATSDDFDESYFHSLWQYFELGRDDIAAYLMQLDVSEFDPKAPPPKTRAFWEIVNASRPAESSDMADTLDRLGRPEVVTMFDLTSHAISSEFEEWLKDRKNRRIIPDHLDRCGYVPVINESDKRDGLWVVAGRRQTVYGRAEMPIVEQIRAVRRRQAAFPDTLV